jgi:hypothetical protein
MKDVCWVVHTTLEGPVEMWEGPGTAAEAHALAKVIPTLFAVITMITHDASFDCDPLAWHKIFDPRADSCDNAPCFVTQHERSLENVVSVPAMEIVMY